jgi:hypothetical protein
LWGARGQNSRTHGGSDQLQHITAGYTALAKFHHSLLIHFQSPLERNETLV